MFDTHAHLCPPHFSESEIPNLVQEARTKGVTHILGVSENLIEARWLLERRIPGLECAVGLHPAYVSTLTRQQVEAELLMMREMVQTYRDRVVAIGEIGLDFTPMVVGFPLKPGKDKLPHRTYRNEERLRL